MRRHLLTLLRCPATGTPLALDELERREDEVRYGVLRGEAGEYPIVAGVPVLLPGYGDAVQLVRAGRPAEAAAAALLHQLVPSRRSRLAAALRELGAGRAAAGVHGAERRRLQAALAPLLDAEAPDPLAVVRLGFSGWAGRNPEAVNYFTYRFGTPRHLVALAAADAAGGPVAADRPALDLGCGVGHLTWALGRQFGQDAMIGVDRSLFQLWAAQEVAGRGGFVCADATALPLATGTFGLVLASDVLSFVHDKWAVAREATRVLTPDGTLAVVAVKSSLHRHVYAGMPVSPDAWRGLAGALPARLYADDRLVERYLAGEPIDGDDAGDVRAARTVTLLAGASATPTAARVGWGSSGDWPHARGPLGVNPLLRLSEERDATLVYRRRLPSPGFADDNEPLRGYLPERVDVPRAAVLGDRLDRRLVEHLLPTAAVVAMPAHSRRAGLPVPTTPMVAAS